MWGTRLRRPKARNLHADRSGVRGKRPIVRKNSASSGGRYPEEPGIEDQFLQIVSKAARTGNPGKIGSSQRIAGFEVILAAAYLADMSPGGSEVVYTGVIHPFRYFMRHTRSAAIEAGVAEELIGLNIRDCISLTR